jgi:hypothetical protein
LVLLGTARLMLNCKLVLIHYRGVVRHAQRRLRTLYHFTIVEG